MGEAMVKEEGQSPSHYADVAVLAFSAPRPETLATPVIREQAGAMLDSTALSDGDFHTAVRIQRPENGRAALVAEFSRRRTIRSAMLYAPGAPPLFLGADYKAVLEASDDALAWNRVSNLPISSLPTTIGFAPVTGRYFRLVFDPKPGNVNPALQVTVPGIDPAGLSAFAALMEDGASGVEVAEFRLSGEDRIDRFETKAAFEFARDYHALDRDTAEAPGIDRRV